MMMFVYKRGGNGSLNVLTILIMSVHNRLDVDMLEVCYLKKSDMIGCQKSHIYLTF